MINVAIVDDHTLFRQGILLMLERYPKYKVIGDFGSAQEVMTFLKESKVLPDIMLLDISLPDHSG
ncbi:MAG: response regulator, partial [Saprospiraceae bacterium]|nr:response regulator [Saprospiraceae bacterium]